jgi:exosortase H (IPTLxxWG-CTERM-specific)
MSGGGPGHRRGRSAGGSPGDPRRNWFGRNRRDIRFLLIFAAVIGLYYCATVTGPMKNRFFPAYLALNARLSGALLTVLGQKVTVEGRTVASADGTSLSIERGCDAVDPSALFVAAVIASPVRLAPKLIAAIGGTFILMILNLVRVISLFFVRIYWPRAFDTVHLDVWQALFIFLAILMWGVWASRAARTAESRLAER